MKNILLPVLLCAIVSSVMSQDISPETIEDLNKLKWIEATWIRTNNKGGQSGQERWVKSAPFELKGQSFTMKGSDTLFVEWIHIRVKDNQLYYVADVPENNKEIYFKLTEVNSSGFVCENPDHDFPKKITYDYKNNILKASISGGGKEIDYYFIKQQLQNVK